MPTPIGRRALWKGAFGAVAGAALGACVAPPGETAEVLRFAGDLHNPRGITFDAHGNLLVAEAGYGKEDNDTGRVSTIGPSGDRTTLLDGLPLHFDAAGESVGPSAVLARGDEVLLLTGRGWGFPSRSLASWSPSGGLAELSSLVWDLSAYQGDVTRRPVRNPFDMAIAPDGWIWVVDSDSNEILRVAPDGESFEIAVDISNPEGRDPPAGNDEVPTGIAFGPDGSAYVAMFSHRPHTLGSAWIGSIDGAGKIRRALSGLTMAIDVAFDGQGRLYALEFSQHFGTEYPSLYQPDSGRVKKMGGRETVIVRGLPFPTSMTFGPDGYCYLALNGAFTEPGMGWIGRVKF